MKRQPIYAYVVALFLGLLAAAAPSTLPLPSPSFVLALAVSTVIFGVTGLVLALLWPGGGWKWALWVVAPGTLLVTMGVIGDGDVYGFLTDDVPYLVLGLIGAAVGGRVGARMRSSGSPPAGSE